MVRVLEIIKIRIYSSFLCYRKFLFSPYFTLFLLQISELTWGPLNLRATENGGPHT